MPNWSMALQRRPDAPRGELLLAHAVLLAARLLAARHGEDLLEDTLAHRLDRRARQDHARIDVHVLAHVVVQRRVRRDLEQRRVLADITESSCQYGLDRDGVAQDDKSGNRGIGLNARM